MLARMKTLQQLFKRYRRPGDLVFAVFFLLVSLILLSQIGNQAQWKAGTQFASQPAFWPAVSLIGMAAFAFLNWVSAFVSPRLAGRWQEVEIWFRALEFVGWFMAYVFSVPLVGYLPATIVFAVIMSLRMGYRSPRMLGASVAVAVSVVVVFKSFLQVKVPGGKAYEFLPDVLRSFMLTYF